MLCNINNKNRMICNSLLQRVIFFYNDFILTLEYPLHLFHFNDYYNPPRQNLETKKEREV